MLEARSERLGRLVHDVRVVVVDEEKERLVVVPAQPRQGRVGGVGGHALVHVCAVTLHLVVVGVEALVQTEAAVEDERAHERRRREASLPENLGERHVARTEAEREVVVNTVRGRVQAGQHRAVRRQRHGHRRYDVLEADALAGDRVDARRGGQCIAVAAETVRPAGVDADQDDALDRGAAAGREPPRHSGDGGDCEQEDSNAASGHDKSFRAACLTPPRLSRIHRDDLADRHRPESACRKYHFNDGRARGRAQIRVISANRPPSAGRSSRSAQRPETRSIPRRPHFISDRRSLILGEDASRPSKHPVHHE